MLLLLLCLVADPFQPPENVQLTRVTRKQLTFSWNAVVSSCPAISYAINSTGCGICPNSSTLNTTNCVDYNTTTEQSCTFAVQTVVCGDVISLVSNSIQLILRGIMIELSHTEY